MYVKGVLTCEIPSSVCVCVWVGVFCGVVTMNNGVHLTLNSNSYPLPNKLLQTQTQVNYVNQKYQVEYQTHQEISGTVAYVQIRTSFTILF